MVNLLKTIRSNTFKAAIMMMAALLLVFSAGCGDSDDLKSENDVCASASDIVSFLNTSGYDIALALDESDSISEEGIRSRNRSAKTLVHMLSEDCRIAVSFFSKEVRGEEPFVSVGIEESKVKILKVLDRERRYNDGTNLNAALSWALDVHDSDSTNQKVIIIMTDGANYVSTTNDGSGKKDDTATNNLTSELGAIVDRAATANNGEPIPIYVVYLESLVDSELGTLRDLFRADSIEASNIGTASFLSGTTNKVIAIQEMDQLSSVLAGIFTSLKNIGYNDFVSSESGLASLSIPEFGATKVQIYSESAKPFTMSSVYSVGGGENSLIYSSDEVISGRPNIVTIMPPEGQTRINAGNWQIQFNGEAPVTGAYSISTEFNARVLFTQKGTEQLEYGMPASAAVVLTGQDGEPLTGGKKISVSMIFDREYELEFDDGAYRADDIALPCSGDMNYHVKVTHDAVSFVSDGKVAVKAVPDLVDTTIQPMEYSDKEGYVAVGLLTDFTSELDTNAPIKLEFNENDIPEKDRLEDGNEEPLLPVLENGTVYTPENEYNLPLTLKYTNLHGDSKQTNITIEKIASTAIEGEKNNMGQALWALLILIPFILAAAVYLMHRRAMAEIESYGEQCYNVMVTATDKKTEEKEIGHINCVTDSLTFGPALRSLDETVFLHINDTELYGTTKLKDTGISLLLSDSESCPILFIEGQLPVFALGDKMFFLPSKSIVTRAYNLIVRFLKSVLNMKKTYAVKPYAFTYKTVAANGMASRVSNEVYCLQIDKSYSAVEIQPRYLSEDKNSVSYRIVITRSEFFD